MTERELIEVERVLLHIGDARMRARRAAATIEQGDGCRSAIVALRESERRLGEAHRQLTQGTYYAEG
jgi:cellobiose-specific phosphotransferase system component IIA